MPLNQSSSKQKAAQPSNGNPNSTSDDSGEHPKVSNADTTEDSLPQSPGARGEFKTECYGLNRSTKEGTLSASFVMCTNQLHTNVMHITMKPTLLLCALSAKNCSGSHLI